MSIYSFNMALQILIEKFPVMKTVNDADTEYYENLPCVFFESEFSKYITHVANSGEFEDLKKIFNFVEDILKNGDEKIVNLIEVSVVESIFFDNDIKDRSMIERSLGPLTAKSYAECNK